MTPPNLSPTEKLEQDASQAALATSEALSGVEVAVVCLLVLLVCPPLAILVVLVVVPLLVVALVLAVLSTPYLLVHHFRAHDGRHVSLLAHRLRRAGRAVLDLAPHRIVADARKVEPDR